MTTHTASLLQLGLLSPLSTLTSRPILTCDPSLSHTSPARRCTSDSQHRFTAFVRWRSQTSLQSYIFLACLGASPSARSSLSTFVYPNALGKCHTNLASFRTLSSSHRATWDTFCSRFRPASNRSIPSTLPGSTSAVTHQVLPSPWAHSLQLTVALALHWIPFQHRVVCVAPRKVSFHCCRLPTDAVLYVFNAVIAHPDVDFDCVPCT